MTRSLFSSAPYFTNNSFAQFPYNKEQAVILVLNFVSKSFNPYPKIKTEKKKDVKKETEKAEDTKKEEKETEKKEDKDKEEKVSCIENFLFIGDSMMNMLKPVIQKALVDLDGKAFKLLKDNREAWAYEMNYVYPGPIQYFGPSSVCDNPPISIKLLKEQL